MKKILGVAVDWNKLVPRFPLKKIEMAKYGFFRPIVKEVVDRYLDCGNPRCGFALTERWMFFHEDRPKRSPAFGVPIAGRSGFLCSPAGPGDSAPPVMPSGLRNGASGCGKRFSWTFRIVDYLKLTFAAAKPPPSQATFQEIPMAADPPFDYFS